MSLKELEVYDKDCPYHCTKGILYHPRLHTESVCPYCSKLRQDNVYASKISSSTESVEKLLGIQERVVGKAEYSFDTIFRGGIDKMEPTSLSEVRGELDKLVSDLSLGELPSYSILFNLGPRVFEDNFVNPILIRAYLAGINVAPLLTVHSIASLRRNVESVEYVDEDAVKKYDEYINADLCVVVLDEGITRSGLDLVKGFVYARGRLRKATVLLTHSTLGDIFYAFASEEDYDYCVPKLVRVRFKKKEESLKSSDDIVSTTTQYTRSGFNSLSSSKDFL